MADGDEIEVATASTAPPSSVATELWAAWKNGMGMFIESYFIFAIGNINNIWKIMYPDCFKNSADCNQFLVKNVTLVEIGAIIVGMLGFGLLADSLGRLWGARCTVSCMLVGSIGFTVAFGMDLTGQFSMWTVFMILFAFGVGGEYPMASTIASERSEADNLGRGRTVVFTFAMQGWGNFVNTAFICFLLAVTTTGLCSPNQLAAQAGSYTGVCDFGSLQGVWRGQYAFGIPFVFILWYLRFFVFQESKVWLKRQAVYRATPTAELRAKRWRNTKMLFSRKYIGALFGCCAGWFVWDISFYGNKLFAGTIVQSIVGSTNGSGAQTLQAILNVQCLNAFIALVGYYFAAFTIDYKWMGRVKMQCMGFAVITVVSLIVGYLYTPISANVPLFEFLYYVTSFFGQWGPNATTWLLPVELFPTDIRTQAHGVSAAWGKLGALITTIVFTMGNNGGAISTATIFLVSGYSCFIGVLVTIVFIRDMTGIPLSAVDQKWLNDIDEANPELSKEGALVADGPAKEAA